IPRGSFTAVVGASASGKSTLLSLIACLKKPNVAACNGAPELIWGLSDGRSINLLKGEQVQAGDIGYVFQEPQLMKPLSAFANFQAAGLIAGNEVSIEKFRAFTDQAGFWGTGKGTDREVNSLSRKPIGLLSGGQAQRIAVGRALAADPELLVCDEPTS